MATPSFRLSPRHLALPVLAVLLLTLCSPISAGSPLAPQQTLELLVQAESVAAAEAAVLAQGGTIRHRLALIDGVAATLSHAQLAALQAKPGLHLFPDASVLASGQPPRETDTDGYRLFPAAATSAHALHAHEVVTQKSECKDERVVTEDNQEEQPLQGRGVTVAVIDSGLLPLAGRGDWKVRSADGTLVTERSGRCLVYRDFLPRSVLNGNAGPAARNSADQSGHGTHVAGTIADNRDTPLKGDEQRSMVGVAPQVNLMVARVLDRNGQGNYSDVIAAIEWVLAHQERYNVRVLNLSLYAPVGAPYWADPLNQAVMRAWQAGIVVVTAAGNSGPEAGTITAPGNIPYVITVGAVRSGRFNQSGFDELAAYSSRGPTESAFVKPDVVVPASRTIAPLPQHSAIVEEMPSSAVVAQAKVDFKLGAFGGRQVYGELSGTSMAAAQVSGIVALMLQVNPSLSNDQVKARLLNTARPAVDATTGAPIYSVWEQGAGLVDAQSAVFAPDAGRANEGMDLALDLTTDTHYWGNTIWDEATSQFLLVDPSTGQQLQAWGGGSYVWAGGSYVWAGGSYVWAGGSYVWAGGSYVWAGNTALWAGALRPWLRITGATAASASVLYEP